MKNKANKVAQRSLAHVQHRNKVSDSQDDLQPEFGNVAIVAKSRKKHISPQTPPNVSAETRISSEVSPARSLRLIKVEPTIENKSDQFKTALQRRQTRT